MLVALIYNTMATDVLVLTLAVLSVGMLALRQFAHMRHKLEMIVAERTQKLEEKTRELEHSHATGDAVLRRVAVILRDRCRASDVLARYGGEEFLLCSPTPTCVRRGGCARICASPPGGLEAVRSEKQGQQSRGRVTALLNAGADR